MYRVLVYLTITFVLVSYSWSSTVEDSVTSPWTHTKYLDKSNWTTFLKPNPKPSKLHRSVWIVFYYLNYCGLCKSVQPGWETIARYASGWSRYIKFGAADCAGRSSENSEICEDQEYPQWRIFCPMTNSTQLAFDANLIISDKKPENILMWSIRKINKEALKCYGKSWPIRPAIEPKTREEINQLVSKNLSKFQLFVSDDIFLYSLYVLNHSKTVFKEPIYRVPANNPIFPSNGIWIATKSSQGELNFEQIDARSAMAPFSFENISDQSSESAETKKLGTIHPTLSDVDSAVVWMITKDLHTKLPVHLGNVKAWLAVLQKYFPGSSTTQQFIDDLVKFLYDKTTISPSEFQHYVKSDSSVKLPKIQFDHCNGSDPTKRGYPCSLWLLFHGMTAKQAVLAEQNKLDASVKPSDLIVSIREFIRTFFRCAECSQHFTNMTSNAENEIDSFKETVLYLWRGHNQVNKRLRYEETSADPAWPKVPFPTKKECDSCVRQTDEEGDALEFDENQTYEYLKSYYNFHSITVKKSNNGHKINSNVLVVASLISTMFFLLLS